MTKIKFGTDGWRAIIAKEYTVDNVKRVAYATAQWVKNHPELNQSIVLGFDCRFGGRMFAEVSACVFAKAGLKTLMANEFVSTPMVSLGAHHYQAACLLYTSPSPRDS